MTNAGAQDLQPRLLVVDDDLITRTLVVRGLRDAGFNHVQDAEDGMAAKELLSSHAIDVIITDVMMPRIDGLELIRWGKHAHPEIVWIILSGVDTFNAAVEAIHLGAFDFLAKPPNLKELEVSVRNALTYRRLIQEKEALHRNLEQRVQQLEALCRILGDQAEQISQDLRRAEVIQGALLPQDPPAMKGLSVHSFYRPGRFVGGDLYDVMAMGRDKIAIYVADASGHGVSAAMLSVLFKQRLPKAAGNGEAMAPADVLSKINAELVRDVSAPGMFITAVYCLIDVGRGRVDIASAGHTPVQLVRGDGTPSTVARTGPALGLYGEPKFDQVQIDFQPGDRLFLYSDGLADPDGEADAMQNALLEKLGGEAFSAEAFLEDQFAALPSASTCERDDVTMVVVERRDGPSRFDNGGAERAEQGESAALYTAGSMHYGVMGETAVINVCGKGTYMMSHNFFDAVQALIKEIGGLTLDLSGCRYLDSTFLGMIHEVVAQGDRDGIPVHLQMVDETVHRLFEELDMDLVLDHIREFAEPLPAMMPLMKTAPDQETLHRRMLQAHDVLASLSQENRLKFQDLVDMLKKELDDKASGPQGNDLRH